MAGYLAGKVVVVTGGGRGIGRGIALAAAREGADVVVADYGGALHAREGASSKPADDVVAEITGAGGRAVAAAEDVSTMEGAATSSRPPLTTSAASTAWSAARDSRSRSTCARWTSPTGTT